MSFATRLCLSLLIATAVTAAAEKPKAETEAEAKLADLLRGVRFGNLPAVQEALNSGADINGVEKKTGQTPFLAACLGGLSDLAEFLLENKADMYAKDINGYDAMHAAAFQGRPDVTEMLLRRGFPANSFHAGDGFAPIHRAAWGDTYNHSLVVEVLVEKGGVSPDVPAKGANSSTPLMCTTISPIPFAASSLIRLGANLDAQDDNGMTVVMRAALTERTDHLVYALVQAGADLDIKDKAGRSAREYVLEEAKLSAEDIVITKNPHDDKFHEGPAGRMKTEL